jgi:hypothetical protein
MASRRQTPPDHRQAENPDLKMAEPNDISSDPIIAWPTWVLPLDEVIGDLQRLNTNTSKLKANFH